MNVDQIERRLKRSPAMRAVLTGDTDQSLGGDTFVFSRSGQTMGALAKLGMVNHVEGPTQARPRWWTGRLSPLGHGWRRELLSRVVNVEDH